MLHAYQKPLRGKTVGVVFGSFAPLHQGHLDLIMRAKKENDGGCIVIVCGFNGDKGEPLMPHNKRYRYVREFFADDDLVAVYAINDTEIGIDRYPNGWEGWVKEFNSIYDKAAPGCERVWYVGDEIYYNDLVNMWHEEAVLVDRTADNPISATMIRQNPIKNWDKITFPFRRVFSTNILICGTASEGKTVMTADLGKYFNAPYSWEWARDYMKESCISDWEIESTDFIAFLEGQYNLNKKLINSPANHGVFFADSDAMITRMYAEYYSKDESCIITPEDFEKVAVVADEITRKSKWDKIFVLCPHGEFVDDHSRFMAHSGMSERWELFDILCKNLRESGNWDKVTVLDGGYWNNFKTIVDYVKGIIEHGKN
jgi:NadR type nicotinamide-nucleotide adenylyltransferase